ncbi:MAG: nucleotidyltransferase family protein [Nitrospinae bacterium]|nr:nucleotidyltransferase family protein [Nitrospinota bacterium]
MADARHVTAILLAAGLSKRLGRNKLLLPLGGETVVRKTAKAVCESAVSQVILVTGHEEALVKQAVEGLDVRIAHNPRYAGGQSTSMIAGIEAASEDAEAYLFVLGDQPLLTPEIVDRLIARYEESRPDALVAAPVFQKKRGNPTLFAASLKDELLQTSGDAGGRNIIQRLKTESPEKIVFLELPNDDIFLDIDTEEDYERMLRKFP